MKKQAYKNQVVWITGGVGVYSAFKYAMRALGQTLSMELHESGVTSTVISPG